MPLRVLADLDVFALYVCGHVYQPATLLQELPHRHTVSVERIDFVRGRPFAAGVALYQQCDFLVVGKAALAPRALLVCLLYLLCVRAIFITPVGLGLWRLPRPRQH